MKKILFEDHGREHYYVDCVVDETNKSYVVEYYCNVQGCYVGKSYFRKSSDIVKVLDYWKGDEVNIVRILTEEFFGNGYRNFIYKVQ